MRARLVEVMRYHGGQVVLGGASLAVGGRARIGLVGPNGVGSRRCSGCSQARRHPIAGRSSSIRPT
jgi:ABC-type branched-subunit amino acid transport system ATPase component